jgi:hypothetical protein
MQCNDFLFLRSFGYFEGGVEDKTQNAQVTWFEAMTVDKQIVVSLLPYPQHGNQSSCFSDSAQAAHTVHIHHYAISSSAAPQSKQRIWSTTASPLNCESWSLHNNMPLHNNMSLHNKAC